jgi:hypothetical protein
MPSHPNYRSRQIRTCDPCGRAVPPGCLTHGTTSYTGDYSACCLCVSRPPADQCPACRAHVRRLALWQVLEAERLTEAANPRAVESWQVRYARRHQVWRRHGGRVPPSSAYWRALWLYQLDVAARAQQGRL